MDKKTENLYFIDTTFEETEANRSAISEIRSLENFRMTLYKSLERKLQYREYMPPENVEMIENALYGKFTATYDEEKITLKINDVLPTLYIKTRSEEVAYMTNMWETGICRAIKKLDIYPINYERVLVWVNIHYTRKHWDVDNRYVKPIIDGIVMSGIVNNDTYSSVKYGVGGYNCEDTPYTEVCIYGKKSSEKISIKKCKEIGDYFW